MTCLRMCYSARMSDCLDQYNVTWNTPSRDSSGSMPLGNGDIGINVWVEESGDVVLLIGKGDAWDENCSLLKLGRIRLKVSPLSLTPFQQTLRTRAEAPSGLGRDCAVAGSARRLARRRGPLSRRDERSRRIGLFDRLDQ